MDTGDLALTAEIMDLIRGIVEHEGMELVAVEYHREPSGRVLRVYIDKAGGVTVDDCSFISGQLGDVLDVKESLRYAYKLEVSSPGLNRPLAREKDFVHYIGERIAVTTRAPVGGRKHFKGKLLDYREDAAVIDCDGSVCAVPYAAIRKANVEYDFTQQHGRKKKK